MSKRVRAVVLTNRVLVKSVIHGKLVGVALLLVHVFLRLLRTDLVCRITKAGNVKLV